MLQQSSSRMKLVIFIDWLEKEDNIFYKSTYTHTT